MFKLYKQISWEEYLDKKSTVLEKASDRDKDKIFKFGRKRSVKAIKLLKKSFNRLDIVKKYESLLIQYDKFGSSCDLQISFIDDSYFLVITAQHHGNKYYICDEIDGLLQFLYDTL